MIETTDKFKVVYHGLFDKMNIAEVDDEKSAQDMCYQHNKTVPRHWLDVGIGHMSYQKIKR